MFRKMFTSMGYRIAASIFLLEAVMMMLVLGQTLVYSQESTRSQLQENEEVILRLLANLSQTALFNVEFGELQQYMDEVIQDPHILRVLVADNQNRIVISTEFSDVGQAFEVPNIISEKRFWRKMPIEGLGVIALEFSNEALLVSQAQILKRGVSIALTGMIIIAVAGICFGYLLTRRLTIVTEAAERAADGDLNVRTGFKGADEVAIVGQSFDKMAEKISQTMAEMEINQKQLSDARDELETRVKLRTRELEVANERLQHLSEIDPLTGISNRRRFDQVLEREWSRVLRSHNVCSLIMIDIDFFKLYNDHYGHQQGDDCIIQVAKAINDNAIHRATDLAARYGGEEFVVILPDTDLAGAQVVAESIRSTVEHLAIPHEKSSVSEYVTLSLGIATSCDQMNAVGSNTLVECADQALYQAKKGGRNRVIHTCAAVTGQCVIDVRSNIA